MAHSAARTLAAAFLLALFCATPARADLITVDWDVTPHEEGELAFDDSPYYQCHGANYPYRLCDWLWQGGLGIDGDIHYDFFEDTWLDGYGKGENESWLMPLPGFAAVLISPECKPGLGPCFDLFTPKRMRIWGAEDQGPSPNLFIISSGGGLLKFPSLGGNAPLSIDFFGDEWRNLSWLGYGFYLPDVCESDDPPLDVCDPNTEKALILEDLTFEPVPEPAVMWLLAAGALSVAVRRWCA